MSAQIGHNSGLPYVQNAVAPFGVVQQCFVGGLSITARSPLSLLLTEAQAKEIGRQLLDPQRTRDWTASVPVANMGTLYVAPLIIGNTRWIEIGTKRPLQVAHSRWQPPSHTVNLVMSRAVLTPAEMVVKAREWAAIGADAPQPAVQPRPQYKEKEASLT